jgi:hypothetical protein
MNIILPPPPPQYNPYLFTQAFDAIKRAMLPVVSKDEAAPRVLLQSPDGTVWEITVSNAGVVTAAVNSGKTRL